MQAEGAPAEASPAGYGDGAYEPLRDVTCIVNIVGTAHVQGMAQRWQQAVQAPMEGIGALLEDPNAKPVAAAEAEAPETPPSPPS